MKHLLVDALSVNNLSGRHVLMGHLRELHAARSGRWRFTCLTHRDNASLASDLPQGVTHVQAGIGGAWWQRAAWGRLQFDRLARRHGVDLVLSPAGMLSPGCSLPQIVLAQNPWPLMPAATGLRLRLQKREFARAQQLAWRMTFNSAYMQTLYAEQLGLPTRPSVVVLQGVDEDLFAMRGAGDLSGRSSEILAVSVMAAHKGIEILVDAFASLARTRPLAKLRLIGGWPDGDYRALVDARIAASGVADRIEVQGHVDAATLRASFRRARVFCLPSRCESFGIPAVEAQVAGTPVVVAAGTAAPEIIGQGGCVVAQGDTEATSAALAHLLDDDVEWINRSNAARQNAERYHWPACSQPLVELLDLFAAEGPA